MNKTLLKLSAAFTGVIFAFSGVTSVNAFTQEKVCFYVTENNTNERIAQFADYTSAVQYCKKKGIGYTVIRQDNPLSLICSIVYVVGDVYDDNMLSIIDIPVLKQYLVGGSTLRPEQKERADINNDGRINIMDLCRLQSYLLENQ